MKKLQNSQARATVGGGVSFVTKMGGIVKTMPAPLVLGPVVGTQPAPLVLG